MKRTHCFTLIFFIACTQYSFGSYNTTNATGSASASGSTGLDFTLSPSLQGDESERLASALASLSSTIMFRCEFNGLRTIYVPKTAQELNEWITGNEDRETVQQFLLMEPLYTLYGPLNFKGHTNICGLPNLLPQMARPTTNSPPPDDIPTDNRNSELVKLLFKIDMYPYKNSFPPPRLETSSQLMLRNLALHYEGPKTLQHQGVLRSNAGGAARLQNIHLKDLTGASARMMSIYKSSLIAKDCEFTFQHRRQQRSSSLLLDWTSFIQLENTRLISKGINGRTIEWTGQQKEESLQPSFFKNLTFEAPDKMAHITAINLSCGGSTCVSPLQIKGNEFIGGYRNGIDFDGQFFLQPEGNTGNRWQSSNSVGLACYGTVQDVDVYFVDGSSCHNLNPTTVPSPSPPLPSASPSSSPVNSAETSMPAITLLLGAAITSVILQYSLLN
ncbi:MAG: hypothetical protein ACR2PT_12250 [Endozoicomonas sp.]